MRLGYGRPFWRSLAWVKAPRGFWDAAGWGLLTALICVALSSLLPAPHVKTPMDELLKDRSSLLLMGLFAVTLGPLCEELAFRGFLQPLLVSTFGVAGGVMLQAVPFAALHGAEYAWSWQLLIPLLLAGWAFGWMRHRTGSTAASTYMHAGFNLFEFVGMLAASFLRRS
jgi:membrane protease YdiL (CAAX protease family)